MKILSFDYHAIRTKQYNNIINNRFFRCLLIFTICIFSVLSNINYSYCSLSAVTTTNIQGNEPYFVLSDATTKLMNSAQLLGFLAPSKNDNTGSIEMIQIDSTMATTPTQSKTLTAPKGMVFDDVKIFIKGDNKTYELSKLQNIISDDDGDVSEPNSPLIQGTMKASWYDKNGVLITDLSKELSACDSPYTLSINSINVSINTSYGYPSLNNYGSNSVRYIFDTESHEICSVRPANMTVIGSYNSEVFDTTLGFNISSLKKKNKTYPTTGFRGAKFTLLGSGGDQTNYRCSLSTDRSDISLSGAGGRYEGENCSIRYESVTRITAPININMEYRNKIGVWQSIGSYTVPAPTLWAIRNGTTAYANQDMLSEATSFPALSKCSGENVDSVNHPVYINRQSYLFRRNEFTNEEGANPNDYPEYSSAPIINGQFLRDADTTFLGEWGLTYTYDYSESEEQLAFFWTSEAYSQDSQYEVGTSGNVTEIEPTSIYNLVICRG